MRLENTIRARRAARRIADRKGLEIVREGGG
jgi:hypothetical protein